MNTYKTLSVDYDALQPKEEIFKQESFFKKLIGKYDIENCLDCACGTGRHLYMLHHLWISCSWSDLSDSMIQQATQNLYGLPISLHTENFRTLENSREKTFDLILCMTTSFPHNANDDEAIQTLQSIYDRLSDWWIVVIDNGISDKFLREKPKFIEARANEQQHFTFF